LILLQHEPLQIPKLRIVCADSEVPDIPDAAAPGVQVWRNHEGRVAAYGHTVEGVHWMHLPGLASFRFDGSMDRVTAIACAPTRQEMILDEYRRKVLPMIIQARGQEVLHASAVLTPQGVVALSAPTKTGKSSMAYGLSRLGWQLWADDTVAFETLDSAIITNPLPFGMRLRPDLAAFFDEDPIVMNADTDPKNADRIEREPAPLTALLLLKRMQDRNDGAAVRFYRLSSARAFTDVLANAYYFSLRDVERNRRMMQHYLELVARVPVFEVCFQPGLETLHEVLDGIDRLIRSTLGANP
jgi:hypothetical protein